MIFLPLRILEYKSDTKTNLENRLLDNDKALRLLYENGLNLITNIKANAQNRLVNHRSTEESQADGIFA